MSDAVSTPERQNSPPGRIAFPVALTPAAIDQILADFRTWLEALLEPPPPSPSPSSPTVDLRTLIEQWTALRHEIHLHTRATRSVLEQNQALLEQLQSVARPASVAATEPAPDGKETPESDAEEEPGSPGVEPLLRSLMEIHDHLSIALRQAERSRACPDLPDRPVNHQPRRSSFWSRLWRRSIASRPGPTGPAGPTTTEPVPIGGRAAVDHSDSSNAITLPGTAAEARLTTVLEGFISGYRMSLARIERVLEEYGLQAIPVVGERFNPELMEAVDVVEATEHPPGRVVEEVRRGYRQGPRIIRFAQVKVAR